MLKGGPGMHGDFLPCLLGLRSLVLGARLFDGSGGWGTNANVDRGLLCGPDKG